MLSCLRCKKAVGFDCECETPVWSEDGLTPCGPPIDPAVLPIWYMRDNHTFLRLPLNVDQALQLIRQEFVEGMSYGMLCSKNNELPLVHAEGPERWPVFEIAAREWLKRAVKLAKEIAFKKGELA